MARRLLILLLLALAPNLFGLWAELRSYHPDGSLSLVLTTEMLGWIVYLIVGALFLGHWPLPSLRFEAGAKGGLLGGMFLLVAVPCWMIGSRARDRAFAELAERSAPLVAAIERFEREQGAPPAKLEELVPTYLASVPGTGLGAYPDYEYVTGEPVYNRYGDRWALRVFCPQWFAFDEFWYVPDHDYSRARGGLVERIGDWAYLHE